MLALVLALQIAAGDSTYSSPGLRRFIAEAAAANRAPAELTGYRAQIESDIAFLAPDPRGQEHAGQLEQVESALRWKRSGALDQRVIGYRSRAGLTLSGLTLLRRPWIVPTLYGDRLRLMIGPAQRTAPKSGRVPIGVHPLAEDRDSVYRFSGGDTAVVMQVSGRTIPVVRVHVAPRADSRRQLLVFRGDLLMDASRNQIVRMRGELMVAQQRSLPARLRDSALRGYIYIDIEEGELAQRYWLPTYQRIEVQVRSRLSDEFRPAFRVVTRFRNIEVDTTAALVAGAQTDSIAERLTFAPNDSVNAFSAWLAEIGSEVTRVAASDFDDLTQSPSVGRTAPYIEWSSSHLSDVFRYNKVEGAYTGLAARVVFPRRPQLSAVGHAGYSWADREPHGAAELRWQRGRWRLAVHGENELANTNDFVPPLEGPATLSALFFSIDDFDYVNRSAFNVNATRALSSNGRVLLRLEAGPGFDDFEPRNVRRGLILFDSTFRANRAVSEGRYWRDAIALEINPGISGDLMEPGIGLSLAYERGDGELDWQRVDARVAARHLAGDFIYWGRLQGAALFGGSPLQKIIEFGENKQFGGDRAVVGHVGLDYVLPLLRVPVRVTRWLTLPSPAPAIAIGLQGGWAAALSSETRSGLAAFGYRQDGAGNSVLITAPTDGIRSSIVISLDFFAGQIGLGVARALEPGARWRFFAGSPLL